MLPEISRRCRSCGAAVRAGARFCPQCGEPMADAGASSSAPSEVAPVTREDESPLEVEPRREAESPPEVGSARGAAPSEDESPLEWTPPTREYAAFVQSFDGAGKGAQPGAGETAS
ncbi:MAG TPA: zinc-ribbon domain-containing protein, partial [Pyrinomonadaceae bacterium]